MCLSGYIKLFCSEIVGLILIRLTPFVQDCQTTRLQLRLSFYFTLILSLGGCYMRRSLKGALKLMSAGHSVHRITWVTESKQKGNISIFMSVTFQVIYRWHVSKQIKSKEDNIMSVHFKNYPIKKNILICCSWCYSELTQNCFEPSWNHYRNINHFTYVWKENAQVYLLYHSENIKSYFYEHIWFYASLRHLL